MKIVLNEKAAFDQGLHEIQVLKWLKKGSALHSKHIANLLDYFYFKVHFTQEHLFLVYELLGDPVTFLQGAAPELIWTVARQLAIALSYVHSRNTAHGNLHCDNVLQVDRAFPQGVEVRLTGFSKSPLPGSAPVPSQTAPEGYISAKSDAWDLGRVLTELYTGWTVPVGDYQHVSLYEIAAKTAELHAALDDRVEDPRLCQLLKQLLTIDLQQRAAVGDLLENMIN